LEALQAVYPSLANGAHKPHGYWKDKANQKSFFDQLAIKWNIKNPEDWNKFTTKDVLREGGGFIVTYYNESLRQGNILSF
jgi:hypothetical protein